MSTKWHLLRVILIFPVFLSVWMERVSAISIQLIPPYPAVGQSVTLRVTGITGNIRQFTWYKGPNADASNSILSYTPSANPPQLNGAQYFSRASGLPDASLLISDLEITDRGNYTVTVQTLHPAQQTSVNLTVYEYVTDPVVKSNTSEVKENDTVALTCETKNANRIMWVRASGSLPSDTILSKDNRTITFPSIKRSAAGDYYCEAENPVSKKKSNIYTLTVNYGPEQVRITGDVNFTAGSFFTLECFAESLPKATFKWTHNGKHLNSCQERCSQTATSDTQGVYTCIASNSVTKINASTSVNVTVNVTVNASSPEANDGLLSPGVITGIVVAVIAAALIVALIFLLLMQKERKKHSASTNRKQNVSVTVTSGNGQTNDAAAEHEIEYTSVNFAQRPPRKVQMAPSDENVVYSDLRLP